MDQIQVQHMMEQFKRSFMNRISQIIAEQSVQQLVAEVEMNSCCENLESLAPTSPNFNATVLSINPAPIQTTKFVVGQLEFKPVDQINSNFANIPDGKKAKHLLSAKTSEAVSQLPLVLGVTARHNKRYTTRDTTQLSEDCTSSQLWDPGQSTP